MSLKFVTRKLKTQKLEEQEQQQQLEQGDKFRPDQEKLPPVCATVSIFKKKKLMIFFPLLFN